MTGMGDVGFWWAASACFGLMILSAVLPWMNAELIVLSLPAIARSPAALIALVVVATIGHMTGKSAIYWLSRRGAVPKAGRLGRWLDRWRERGVEQPGRTTGLVLLSSLAGVPPFLVMTAVAGAIKLPFGLFLAAGT